MNTQSPNPWSTFPKWGYPWIVKFNFHVLKSALPSWKLNILFWSQILPNRKLNRPGLYFQWGFDFRFKFRILVAIPLGDLWAAFACWRGGSWVRASSLRGALQRPLGSRMPRIGKRPSANPRWWSVIISNSPEIQFRLTLPAGETFEMPTHPQKES